MWTIPRLRACAAWKVAAGKKIAEHTRATRLVRGSLVVEVEDQVWQRQLTTLCRRSVAQSGEGAGRGAGDRHRFSADAEAARAAEGGKGDRAGKR